MATLYKRGTAWWVSLIHNGKRYRLSTKTASKKEAEQILAQVLIKLKLGDLDLPIQNSKPQKPKPINKEISYEEFYEKHYLPFCYGRQAFYHSMKKYFMKKVPTWFKELKLINVKAREIESLQTHFLNSGLMSATVNRYTSIVKHSLTKAFDWEFIDSHQLEKVRKVSMLKGETKRLRFLSQEEMQALLNSCDDSIYPIVFLALSLGMRKGEILNLKWSSVDLSNGLILLEKTKNNERRELPMSQPLKEMFSKLFANRRIGTDYVFVNPKTGNRLTDIKKSFHTALKKAKIEDFRFHDLRHCTASWLAMSNVGIRTIQEILGHRDIRMTLRYSHLNHAHKKEAVDTLAKIICHNFVTQKSQAN